MRQNHSRGSAGSANSFRAAVAGHYWTLSAFVGRNLSPPRAAPADPWTCNVPDARLGSVKLSGFHSQVSGAQDLLVIVHGLGGSAESAYTFAITALAAEAKIACLRINLRGADRRGEDFFHAGLGADLDWALKSPELARYERVGVLGYSIGGHVALRHALDSVSPRLRAVCAVCPPLWIAEAAAHFDEPRVALYRRHVLTGLKEMYRAFCARAPQPDLPSVEEADAIHSIREWDDRIVAPRHGFDSGAHYYQSVSAGPELAKLTRRTLIVSSANDPMLPALQQSLPDTPQLEHRHLPYGGHLGFPRQLDLEQKSGLGLERQLLAWLIHNAFSETGSALGA